MHMEAFLCWNNLPTRYIWDSPSWISAQVYIRFSSSLSLIFSLCIWGFLVTKLLYFVGWLKDKDLSVLAD